MAEVQTNVQVTPNITLTSPTNAAGSEVLAAALLKSSENQAASTQALVAALVGAREPAAGLPAKKKQQTNAINAGLVALIVFLLWK